MSMVVHLLSHLSRSCSTGAVHSGSTSSLAPHHPQQPHRDCISAKSDCSLEEFFTLTLGPMQGNGEGGLPITGQENWSILKLPTKTHQSISRKTTNPWTGKNTSSKLEIPPIITLEISSLRSPALSEILYKYCPFVQFPVGHSCDQRAAIPGFIFPPPGFFPSINLLYAIYCLKLPPCWKKLRRKEAKKRRNEEGMGWGSYALQFWRG